MKKQSSKILFYFFIPLLFFSKISGKQIKDSLPHEKIVKENSIPYELQRLILMEKVRVDKIVRLQNSLEMNLVELKNVKDTINEFKR